MAKISLSYNKNGTISTTAHVPVLHHKVDI
jgi:hypothetical protein